jgi:hypothetical protein
VAAPLLNASAWTCEEGRPRRDAPTSYSTVRSLVTMSLHCRAGDDVGLIAKLVIHPANRTRDDRIKL